MRLHPTPATFDVTTMNRLISRGASIANVSVVHVETPSPINPLGVKGAGEGGTIPAPAAIVAAIEDALSPWNVSIAGAPVTPSMIVEKVRAGG